MSLQRWRLPRQHCSHNWPISKGAYCGTGDVCNLSPFLSSFPAFSLCLSRCSRKQTGSATSVSVSIVKASKLLFVMAVLHKILMTVVLYAIIKSHFRKLLSIAIQYLGTLGVPKCLPLWKGHTVAQEC